LQSFGVEMVAIKYSI